MGDVGDDYRAYDEWKKERKAWHQENTLPKDIELLKRLDVQYTVEGDGAGGDKYVIRFTSKRGNRIVDWWTSTGTWVVRVRNVRGKGIPSLARQFNLKEKCIHCEILRDRLNP